MPKRKRGPRRGDFVLWEDETCVIEKIKGRVIVIAPIREEGYEEVQKLLIDSLVSTDIKVWDTEGESIEDQEEY